MFLEGTELCVCVWQSQSHSVNYIVGQLATNQWRQHGWFFFCRTGMVCWLLVDASLSLSRSFFARLYFWLFVFWVCVCQLIQWHRFYSDKLALVVHSSFSMLSYEILCSSPAAFFCRLIFFAHFSALFNAFDILF